MTDTRATQALLEHWFAANPAAQVTSVFVEHWATAASGSVQALVTMVAVEHWASADPPPVTTQAVRVMVLA
jgi:hypothetical protein